MKVCFVGEPRIGYTNPSVRYRVFLIAKELIKRGWKIDIFNQKFEIMKVKKIWVFPQLLNFLIHFLINRYKIVVNHRCLPFTRFLYFLKNIFNFYLILDIDDNTFLYYNLKTKNEIKKVLDMYDCVILCSHPFKDYLIDEIGVDNKKIKIIPTFFPYIADKSNLEKKYKNKVVIGWMGLSQNIIFFKDIENVLFEIYNEFKEKVELAIITSQDYKKLSEEHNIKFPPFLKFIRWDPKTFLKEMDEFDIGIVPQRKGLGEMGKCSVKGIQMMAKGIPLVCDASGEYNYIIKNYENGFLVKNEEEWYKWLKLLINDKKLREYMGRKAREFYVNNYAPNKIITYYESLFESILKGKI